MFEEQSIIKQHHSRAQALVNIVLMAFALILGRLWYLQIYKGDLLYQYSMQNRLRKEIVRAPRGKIYSRNMELLVDNVPRLDAILTPQYLRDKKKTLKRLSEILSIPLKRIEKIVKSKSYMASYRPIIIKKNISEKEVALIETENDELPGISIDTFISREYFDKTTGAHLLGYISEISQEQLPKYRKRDKIPYRLGDFIGQFGLEEQMDLTLRGSNGHEFVEVDAFGRKKREINDQIFKDIKNKPSVPGKNLKLTIDRDMQQAAFEALDNKVGSAVAIDVNTGEILAMVSRPSFDPSTFARELTNDYWQSLIQNKDNPLRDRTIQEHYSPGSTFKAITAVAGIEEGLITQETEHTCHGFFKLGRRRYHCWKQWGHGKVDIVKAIRESCNVFFQKVATKIDIDVLSKYASAFGFGQKTGLALPREISGLVPTKKWKMQKLGKEWQLGETLSCAIGQSFVLATPIQMAMAYSVIANGGTLFRPYVIKEVFNDSGEKIQEFSPEVVNKSNFKPETLEMVKRGLYDVVNNYKGTAFWHRGKGIQMLGKTGTSQVVRSTSEKLYLKCEEQPEDLRHHGLFIGFAPYTNPKVVVAAVVEHGCHGSSAAAPVAEKVLEVYMKKYQPEIYKQNLKVDKKVLNEYLAYRAEKEAKAGPEKKEEQPEDQEE